MKFINSKFPFHFTQGFYFFRRQLDIKDFQVFFDAMPWGFLGSTTIRFSPAAQRVSQKTHANTIGAPPFLYVDLKLFGGGFRMPPKKHMDDAIWQWAFSFVPSWKLRHLWRRAAWTYQIPQRIRVKDLLVKHLQTSQNTNLHQLCSPVLNLYFSYIPKLTFTIPTFTSY